MWSTPCSAFLWPLTVRAAHCKGLTNHQAVKGAVYKPRYHWIYPFLFYFFYTWRVICKYHDALVLYIPLNILYYSLKPTGCLQQQKERFWRQTMTGHSQKDIPLHLTNCSMMCVMAVLHKVHSGVWLKGPNWTLPALRPLSSGPKPLNEVAASEEFLHRKQLRTKKLKPQRRSAARHLPIK